MILVQNLSVPFDRRVWMEANTLQQSGYEVHIVCPRSKQDIKIKEVVNDIKIYRYPGAFEGRGTLGTIFEYLWGIFAMSSFSLLLALRNRFSVVQVCNPPDLLFLAAWGPRILNGSRIIFDQHDLNPELWEAKGHSQTDLIGKLLALAEKITYKFATVVISTNMSYRDVAIGRGRKQPEDVFVVRSAPRLDFAPVVLPKTRSSADAKRLVYLGTMGIQEGVDVLIDSIKILVTDLRLDDLELNVIGEGPELENLISKSNKLGLSKHIKFYGRISDSELKKLILGSDIALNPDRPSQMNDLSSMNKIVEYMAMGRPILQFASKEGMRTAKDASLYIQTLDAATLATECYKLLQDKKSREEMGEYGHRRFIESLSWETQEMNLINAYSRAISKN